MDSGSASSIVVKRTFIEVNSPSAVGSLRLRACSDSALFKLGEEALSQYTQQRLGRPVPMAGKVEFELEGMSDADTISDQDHEGERGASLPCYAHLRGGQAAATPDHQMPGVGTPTFYVGLELSQIRTLEDVGVLGAHSADPAIDSDSGSDDGASRAPSASGDVDAAQEAHQDLDLLLQENQRLAYENQMLRASEYWMPVADSFAMHGGASSSMAVAPGAWMVPMAQVSIMALPADMCMVQQRPQQLPDECALQRTSRRQRGRRAGAGAAAGAWPRAAAPARKGDARGGRLDASGATDVTLVPEHERTTVMLRNLPNNYSRAMLLNLMDQEGFAGLYDFLYLPIDFKSRAALGYAFINLTHPGVVPAFWKKFDGFSNWILPSRKVCHVSWSGPHQGLEDHVDRYRNSPIMHATVADEHKPAIFQGGVMVPFPEPTKATRAPRIRNKPATAETVPEGALR